MAGVRLSVGATATVWLRSEHWYSARGFRLLDQAEQEQIADASIVGIRRRVHFSGQGEVTWTFIVPRLRIVRGGASADVNTDGQVDVQDLAAVLLAWGGTGGPADTNGDGSVDVQDLAEVLLNWGPCP